MSTTEDVHGGSSYNDGAHLYQLQFSIPKHDKDRCCDGSDDSTRSTDGTNVILEVCNIGATITKFLIPSSSLSSEKKQQHVDIVLGYDHPEVNISNTKNPCFLGCVVGRVANRIEDGTFTLLQPQTPCKDDAMMSTKYMLDINNPPNHLHGGYEGFHLKKWKCERYIKDGKLPQIKFSLVSPDGDQGYPASIKASVTYSLRPTSCKPTTTGQSKQGVTLHIEFDAELLEGEKMCTPINMAQHSYFNLAGHSSKDGILDHTLYLPASKYYTPTNDVQIPLQKVLQVQNSDASMNFYDHPKLLKEALKEYYAAHNILNVKDVSEIITNRAKQSSENDDVKDGNNDDVIFGFDHNFVVSREVCTDNSGGSNDNKKNGKARTSLTTCAVLHHPKTKRTLTVRTTTPGLQVYTSNYLNGKSPIPTESKDGALYTKWQGICLETQYFPSSINLEEDVLIQPKECKKRQQPAESPLDFSYGRCPILKHGGPPYYETIEYDVTWE